MNAPEAIANVVMVHPSSSLDSHSLRGLCAPSGACAHPHQPAPREIRTWRDPRSAISTPSAGQIASELAPHRSQGHSCTAARLSLGAVFGKSSVGCDPPRCRGPKPARARRRWTEEDRPRVTLRRRRRDRCAPTRPSPRATARKRAARLSTRRGHASNSSWGVDYSADLSDAPILREAVRTRPGPSASVPHHATRATYHPRPTTD